MREGLVLTGIAADRKGNAETFCEEIECCERVQTTQMFFYYFSSLKVVNECMARNRVTVKYCSVTYLY